MVLSWRKAKWRTRLYQGNSCVCERTAGFLSCGVDSTQFQSDCYISALQIDLRCGARGPNVPHLSFSRAGGLGSGSSSPTRWPSHRRRRNRTLWFTSSRKFLPPPPWRKEDAGAMSWLTVTPESLQTWFLGLLSPLQPLSWPWSASGMNLHWCLELFKGENVEKIPLTLFFNTHLTAIL